MIRLEQKLVQEMDELLALLAQDGYTLELRPQTEADKKRRQENELNDEQKKQATEELISFYESIKYDIGNHVYGGTVYALGAVELHISDVEEEEVRFELKQAPMIVEGKEVEESCDRCYHRLTCVTQETGLCDEYDDEVDEFEDEEQVGVQVQRRLIKEHNLKLNREVLITHLKQHGFQPQPVFEGKPYLMETTWFKDNLRVCF